LLPPFAKMISPVSQPASVRLLDGEGEGGDGVIHGFQVSSLRFSLGEDF
jgi:hypothetical protein